MTNRIPLIVNAGAAQIQEIAAADTLQVPGNLTANVIKTDNYQYANGQPFVSSNYGDANVEALLSDGSFTGNIIPNGNATQSLGNATNQWKDLWVSNSTIYINSIPLGVGNAGVLQFNGNDIVTSGPNVINTGNVETSGDVIGGNLVIAAGGTLQFPDGSTQASAYGNANVEAYLPSSNTIILINSNIANTDSNVANLNATVANLATSSSLANTDSNVANLTTALANTDSNVANLTTSLANTDSNVANLVTITTNTDSNVANLTTALANTDSNVSNLSTSLSNTDSNVANLVTITTNTDSNVANLTTALGNTDSNVSSLSNSLSSTNSNVANLTATVDSQANAIANLQGATYANANVAAYLPIYTGDISGNIFTANILVGEGGNISNITGANVTGEVARANVVTNPIQSNITGLGTITSLTANAINVNGLFTANGNAQFNQDVYFAGNVTLPGNIIQISGNSGTFFGNAVTGFGALYAGLPAGYTLLNNEVVQFSDSYDGYTQVSHRNINSGNQATTDFVATADNGDDFTNYVDLGVAGSGYDGLLANNSLGTSLFPNDSYLYAQGNVNGGNLVLGSNQANGVVRIITNGGSNIGDVTATFSASNLSVAGNVTANYFFGNGSQLTGLDSSNAIISINNSIANTNSNVANLTTSLANTDSNVANNTSNIANLQGLVYGNANVAAYLPAYTGNLTAGNISVTGVISATGNVRGANFNTAGLISATGNATAGNVITTGRVSATGNVYGGNVFAIAPAGASFNVGDYFSNGTVVTLDYIGIGQTSFPVGSTITITDGVEVPGLDGTYVVTAASADQCSFLNNVVASTGNVPTGFSNTFPTVTGVNSAVISTSGNVVAGRYVLGDGSLLTNLPTQPGTYTNSNVATFLSAFGSNSISTTGNISVGIASVAGNIITPNGMFAEGNIYTESWLVANNMGVEAYQLNVTTNANVTGNVTGAYAFFSDIQLNDLSANAILYTDANRNVFNTDISYDAATQTMTGGNISTTGNVTAGYFYGDGSNLTGLPAGYSDSNVVTLLASYGSNTISTTGNVTSGNFITSGTAGTGNISGVNYITANYLIGDGSMLTNLPTNAPVVESIASAATITPAALDTQYNVTALAESASFAAPSGTPLDGQKLTIRIIDDGTPRALTWDPIYVVIGTTLPTTTVANKYVYVGCIYNDQESTWDIVSVAQQA